DLLAAANNAGAQGVVSYDDGGGYGHPDHVFAHRIARAVAHALELPFWVIESDPAAGGTLAPEPAETQAHDITPWLDRKVAALRAYQTQLEVVGDEIVHVGGQRHPIGRVESYGRLDPRP